MRVTLVVLLLLSGCCFALQGSRSSQQVSLSALDAIRLADAILQAPASAAPSEGSPSEDGEQEETQDNVDHTDEAGNNVEEEEGDAQPQMPDGAQMPDTAASGNLAERMPENSGDSQQQQSSAAGDSSIPGDHQDFSSEMPHDGAADGPEPEAEGANNPDTPDKHQNSGTSQDNNAAHEIQQPPSAGDSRDAPAAEAGGPDDLDAEENALDAEESKPEPITPQIPTNYTDSMPMPTGMPISSGSQPVPPPAMPMPSGMPSPEPMMPHASALSKPQATAPIPQQTSQPPQQQGTVLDKLADQQAQILAILAKLADKSNSAPAGSMEGNVPLAGNMTTPTSDATNAQQPLVAPAMPIVVDNTTTMPADMGIPPVNGPLAVPAEQSVVPEEAPSALPAADMTNTIGVATSSLQPSPSSSALPASLSNKNVKNVAKAAQQKAQAASEAAGEEARASIAAENADVAISESHPTNSKVPDIVIEAETGAAKECGMGNSKVEFLRYIFANHKELSAKASQKAVHEALKVARADYDAAVNASFMAEKERLHELEEQEKEAQAIANKKETAERKAAADRLNLMKEAVTTAKGMAATRKDAELAASRMELQATLRSEIEDMRQREEAHEAALQDDIRNAREVLAKAENEKEIDARSLKAGLTAYQTQLKEVEDAVLALVGQLRSISHRQDGVASELQKSLQLASDQIHAAESTAENTKSSFRSLNSRRLSIRRSRNRAHQLLLDVGPTAFIELHQHSSASASNSQTSSLYGDDDFPLGTFPSVPDVSGQNIMLLGSAGLLENPSQPATKRAMAPALPPADSSIRGKVGPADATVAQSNPLDIPPSSYFAYNRPEELGPNIVDVKATLTKPVPTVPAYHATSSGYLPGKPLQSLTNPLNIPVDPQAGIQHESPLVHSDPDANDGTGSLVAQTLREADSFRAHAISSLSILQQQEDALHFVIDRLAEQLEEANELIKSREEMYMLATASHREKARRRDELRKIDEEMSRMKVRCNDGTYVHDGMSCVSGVAGPRGDDSEFADGGPVARKIKEELKAALKKQPEEVAIDTGLQSRVDELGAKQRGAQAQLKTIQSVGELYRETLDKIAASTSEINALGATTKQLAPQLSAARAAFAEEKLKLDEKVRETSSALERIEHSFLRIKNAVEARVKSDEIAIEDAAKALLNAISLANTTEHAKEEKLSADYDLRQKRGNVHAATRLQEEEANYASTLAAAAEYRRAADAAAAKVRQAGAAVAAAKRISDVKSAAGILAAQTAAVVEAERAKLKDADADMASNLQLLEDAESTKSRAIAEATERRHIAAVLVYNSHQHIEKLRNKVRTGNVLLRRYRAAVQYSHLQALRVMESGGAVLPTDPLEHAASKSITIEPAKSTQDAQAPVFLERSASLRSARRSRQSDAAGIVSPILPRLRALQADLLPSTNLGEGEVDNIDEVARGAVGMFYRLLRQGSSQLESDVPSDITDNVYEDPTQVLGMSNRDHRFKHTDPAVAEPSVIAEAAPATDATAAPSPLGAESQLAPLAPSPVAAATVSLTASASPVVSSSPLAPLPSKESDPMAELIAPSPSALNATEIGHVTAETASASQTIPMETAVPPTLLPSAEPSMLPVSPTTTLTPTPSIQNAIDPLDDPTVLPPLDMAADGVPPEIAALSHVSAASEKVDRAAKHYLTTSKMAESVVAVIVDRLAAATGSLERAMIDHEKLVQAYFDTRVEAAKQSEAACKKEMVVLSDLEAQSVSDADRLAAQTFKSGNSPVLTLGDITGIRSGPGANAPAPVARGPLATLSKIDEHAISHVRQSALEAAQASAHAAEMQAAAAAAEANVAKERSNLAAQRVATAAADSAEAQKETSSAATAM